MPDPDLDKILAEILGGGGTTTKTPAAKPPDIAEFVGATVFDSEGNPYVIKTRVDRNMGTVYWMSAPNGRAFYPDATVWQSATGEIFQFGSTGNIVSSRTLTAAERAGFSGGGGGGGGGGSAPAYSSTRQAELDAQAFAREQAATQFRQQKELDRIRAENERLMQARSDLKALALAGSELYAQTQNILGETLGVDPVRGAIRGSGSVTRGTTPMQGFRAGIAQTGQQAQGVTQQATGALGQPAANATATEGLVGQLQGQLPTLPGTVGPFTGLAGGGMIEMSQGEDGGYGMAPAGGGMHQMPDGSMMPDAEMQGGLMGQANVQAGTRKQAYLLGEGATQVEPGTEVGIVDPMAGTMEVIPLGGGAAEGGTFGFDPSTVRQSLAPVYDYLGFKEAPMYTAAPSLSARTAPSLLEQGRLGVQPELVRTPRGGVLRREGNIYRPVTADAFRANRWNWADVAQLSAQDAARIQQPGMLGAPLTGRVPDIEPGISGRRFPLSATPQYITEGPAGLKGLAIPAVRTIAALLRPGSNLSSQTRDVLMSALRLVGYTPQEIEEERQFFTPSGTAQASGAALLA